jgi:hypothetical protein
MSYGVVIFGDFVLPAAEVAAWRETVLDASALEGSDIGIPKDLVFLVDPGTVDATIQRLPHEPFRFVDVTASVGALVLRGTLDEDTFRQVATEIACIGLAAGKHGGEGTLCFTSQEEDFLTTVHVRATRVRLTTVYGFRNPAGFRQVQRARRSPGYLEVLAKVRAQLAARRGGPAPPPRSAGDLSASVQAIHAACIAGFETIAARPFMEAVAAKNAQSMTVRPGMPPVSQPKRAVWSRQGVMIGSLAMLGKSKGEILSYLRAPFAPCAAAAVELLHRLSPDAAELLAVRYAAETIDGDLAEGAAAALAGRKSEASLDALMRLLDERSGLKVDQRAFSRMVLDALATSRNPQAGDRALALLERAAKKLPKAFARRDAAAVRSLVIALGKLRHGPARPLLKALARNAALRLDAMTAVQQITKGAAATGFHYGARGGLIENKAKPRRGRTKA